MNSREELLKQIDELINTLRKRMPDLEHKDRIEIFNWARKIRDNYGNNSEQDFKVIDLNIDFLRKQLPATFKVTIDELEAYQKSQSTNYLTKIISEDIENKISPEMITDFKKRIRKILNYFKELSEKYDEDRKKLKSYEEIITYLTKLKAKLIAKEELDNNDLEELFKNIHTLDKDDTFGLIVAFGDVLIGDDEPIKEKKEEIDNKTEDQEEYEEIIENENPELIKEELIKIFAKYNLDFNIFFNKLSKQEQEDFLKEIKPKNVEDLLDVLKDFNISLNDAYLDEDGNGYRLIEYKAKQLRKVFLYSRKDVLRRVLKYVDAEKIYNNRIFDSRGFVKQGIDFDLLLEMPSRFIERKRRYKRKGNMIIEISADSESAGASNDFIKNIELFKSFGVDPKEFCKLSTVSVIPHYKIQTTLSVFKLYNIEEKVFLKSLSCFSSIHQAEILDMFIELGQFNYILKNPSRMVFQSDDPMFYRYIYGIKKAGIPKEELIKNNRLKGILLNKDSFGINNENGPEMIRQRKKPEESQLIETISSSFFNDTRLSRQNDIIQLLDDNFLVKDSNGVAVYPEVYNFGSVDIPTGKWDINISRLKVLRICNELIKRQISFDNIDMLMAVITYNSLINEEEYNIIYTQVSSMMKRRNTK